MASSLIRSVFLSSKRLHKTRLGSLVLISGKGSGRAVVEADVERKSEEGK